MIFNHVFKYLGRGRDHNEFIYVFVSTHNMWLHSVVAQISLKIFTVNTSKQPVNDNNLHRLLMKIYTKICTTYIYSEDDKIIKALVSNIHTPFVNRSLKMSATSAPGYYWVDWDSNRGIHPHAVLGGRDSDGTQIYVGRGSHAGDWMPAKVIPQKRIAYVSFNGKEVPMHQFQILCEQKFEWVPCRSGQIPPNAVVGGKTGNGETLYVGRANHKGALTVGKIHPSHKCLYIPFDGLEVSVQNYEVLILR